jgi:hypothetical protein
MTFRTHPQSINIPFPYNGISTNTDNDNTYAAYIQNMTIGYNKVGKLRYGTNPVSSFAFDPARTFRDPIEIMNFIKQDGTSEQLVYVPYISALQSFVDFTINQSIKNTAFSTVRIEYFDEDMPYADKVIFDGVYIYIKQGNSDGADIINYAKNGDFITFDLPFNIAFFERDNLDFALWIERAAIYKSVGDGTYQLLLDNLDPNVIVSSVNFQGKLLIANGVDPVKVYNGATIVNLTGQASIPLASAITVAGNTMQFNIFTAVIAELQNNIAVNSVIRTFSNTETRVLTITNIIYGAGNGDQRPVTITTNNPPQADTRKIFFDKQLPAFSYITIAHKRLWALPPGRPYKNKFRAPELAMTAYYSFKINSLDGWFDEATNLLRFVNGRENSAISDNFETIQPFEGKLYFIGRQVTLEYTGDDPLALDDGQNLTLDVFKWSKTLDFGIYQRRLIVRSPDSLIILSTQSGISAINSLNNISGQIQPQNVFSQPINDYLNRQLDFIETDRDYRSMTAFTYDFGKFAGFKVKYSTIVAQFTGQQFAWLMFTENFADANAFLYDPISQDLFLGAAGGRLLAYADKPLTQSYVEDGRGPLPWVVTYNWLYPGTTWINTYIYFIGQSLKNIDIATRVYLDRDNSKSLSADIEIREQGVLYDLSLYDTEIYSYKATKFARCWRKFCAENFKLELRGQSQDLLIYDKLMLAGGVQDQEVGNANQ